MSAELLDLAISTAGGKELWETVRGLKVDISIDGPVWGMKGWPQGTTFHQIVTLDTVREHILFTPFTRPDRQMVFDAASDSVVVQTLDGEPVQTLAPARAAFKGMLRNTAWDAAHLGYFLGYACWNYFTTPFLFTYPGVQVREIEPWSEAGQTWRRLQVRFPPEIATHSPNAVFYFDAFGMQRRMDYVAEVNNSFLVGHYTGHHRRFDGLLVPTRRRMFRRNPDNSVNLNYPSITVDVHGVELLGADDEQVGP
ncbi:hypothetical protein [Kitasatospora sp. DSM 101779]|uniref:hypothetical protein n=1 Tax=Kitasatospora sp. DSM 101779 TaxID=2853165 RepID=UPI0021D7F656|nr:hypothetical protein [Kitasatospora sp. DSM 101779]MCU7826606.1 hypothetical protein [Kitasatospora sp. DSM 101779]